MSMKSHFAAAAILAGLTAALVSASGLLTVPIAAGAALELALPAGWQATHEAVGPTVTVRITVPSEKLLVLLTVLPVQEGTPASTPDGVKKAVTELGTKALEGATQDHLELTALANPAGTGYAYHVTDRNPEHGPHDYREANQGALLIGRHMITFTTLTHTGDTESVSLAKQMLSSLKIATSASKTDPSPDLRHR